MRQSMYSGDAHQVLVSLAVGLALASLSAFWWAWVHG
jgi:hypothetical protein